MLVAWSIVLCAQLCGWLKTITPRVLRNNVNRSTMSVDIESPWDIIYYMYMYIGHKRTMRMSE